MAHTLDPDPGPRQPSPDPQKEIAARAAIEARFGRTLSDADWDRARAGLMEFLSILRCWRQEVITRGFGPRKAA